MSKPTTGRRCVECGQSRPIAARGLCRTCYSAWYRRENGRRGRRYAIRCGYCHQPAEVVRPTVQFCSLNCAQWARRPRERVQIEVWRPPMVKFPGPRWKPRAVRHPPLHGTLFIQGPCAWCAEPFLVLVGSSEITARYCSRRCSRKAQDRRRGRFIIAPQDRRAIYERDGWTCQLCGDPVNPSLGPSDIWAATLDHIVPRSAGGDHSPKNLRLAHRWCNSVRGDESYYTADDLAA